MVDEGVVVHVLHLVGDDAAARRHFAALALQQDVEAVARVSVEERQGGMVQAAVASLPHEDAAVAGAEQVCLLDVVEAEVRAVAHHDLHDLVRQEAVLRGGAVGDDDVGLGQLVHDDEDATADHRVLFALEDVADLYGMLHLDAPRHVHDQRVDAEHRVQADDAVGRIRYIII